MQNNDSNNYPHEDNIDLKEIFKLLINSKKLIITITLVITTLGAIYSFQKVTVYKSTALIEIGNYEPEEYNQMLIEPAEDLIEELIRQKNIRLKSQGIQNLFKTEDVNFSASFNISYNHNEVTGLNGTVANFGEVNGPGLTGAFVQRLGEGRSLFSYYMAEYSEDADGTPNFSADDKNFVGKKILSNNKSRGK